ncbi:hypothetical protein GIB67_000513 [Kingdonia uniflora]|uniref:Transposase MuDR plant domain-containing protein n=1 Tax=Kingdonia uniflora TaxID=39325 RepID=A0A7J7NUJ8_9MAGN|nr:hypothetical protein GIB67_000513 [Kingdonia uniflora]
MGGNTVNGEHRGGVGDMGVNTDNWSELDPDNLNAEEGYYSTHTSQDGDDGPTQENIDKCDIEFRYLAKEYDNIFVEEEDAVHSVPPQPTYGELKVGMEWATVYECRAYIRQWSIMNKFEYYQEKNENYRVRLFCEDENCEWMFYVRRTTDGHTFTLRKSSNLKHTCSSGAKNRLANATWVTKQVESVMRSMRTTIPVGIQDLISTQFGVDISYYTAWNAWSICKEKIVGSYDEGYIMQPELCLHILHSNPGSIVVVSKYHDTSQWTGTCVMFKESIDGFLNACRPVVGLDGCFLKGLVLVPRTQTHIDKLKRQYGQYKIKWTKKGDGNTGQGITGQYVAIAVSGQRWRVNLGTHECDCHKWQVTGLPYVHAVCYSTL